MASIRELQDEHKVWVDYNFPDQPKTDPLLGIIEEVGELAHAHLKASQGIREFSDGVSPILLKADALGDIFIYMMSYANANHINLSNAIEDAWRQVKKRDWQKYPTDGVTC